MAGTRCYSDFKKGGVCQPCLTSPFKREQEHVNILGEGKQLCKTEQMETVYACVVKCDMYVCLPDFCSTRGANILFGEMYSKLKCYFLAVKRLEGHNLIQVWSV